MARLPLATRESVPENQRAAFDELLRGYGSVPRYGPGSVMINVPNAHRLVNAVNKYLRSESSLPKKLQEFAMLVTARELDCQYIWILSMLTCRPTERNRSCRYDPAPSDLPTGDYVSA